MAAEFVEEVLEVLPEPEDVVVLPVLPVLPEDAAVEAGGPTAATPMTAATARDAAAEVPTSVRRRRPARRTAWSRCWVVLVSLSVM